MKQARFYFNGMRFRQTAFIEKCVMHTDGIMTASFTSPSNVMMVNGQELEDGLTFIGGLFFTIDRVLGYFSADTIC